MPLRNLAILSLFAAFPLAAQTVKPVDAAEAFGARDSVTHLALSPDGMSVAFVAPTKGQGSVVLFLSLAKGSKARPVLTASGTPDRIARCDWVSNERLPAERVQILAHRDRRRIGCGPLSDIAGNCRSGDSPGEWTRAWKAPTSATNW
jgi:hypothetical protein